MMLALALVGDAERTPPTFSAGIEVVRLDVSVTRDGSPVQGLIASDFEVLDEGVRQTVALVGHDETTIHATLALDTSSSVAGEKLAQLKAAAHRFVDALRQDDVLSLLTFSECTDLALVQSRSREEAHAAIDRAAARRTTSLRDASVAAFTVADPALGRPLVLVFSDGQDVGSWSSPERVMELARQSEVVLHAVIPVAEDSPGLLRDLTEETGGRVWQTTEGDRLEDLFLRALQEFRGRYRLQFEPQGSKRGGWHRLQVRLKRGNGRVYARRGYLHRVAD
jgi:VWFA-related protein